MRALNTHFIYSNLTQSENAHAFTLPLTFSNFPKTSARIGSIVNDPREAITHLKESETIVLLADLHPKAQALDDLHVRERREKEREKRERRERRERKMERKDGVKEKWKEEMKGESSNSSLSFCLLPSLLFLLFFPSLYEF